MSKVNSNQTEYDYEAEQLGFTVGEPLKITKPIRLIELFAGYGSQALALKYLGVPFESWKISEWAVNSIQAYKDLHTDDDTDYSEGLSIEEVRAWLCGQGISSDYSTPMTQQQINRLGEDKARTIYNNIKATHNLVNICNIHGSDLEITDTDKYCYIMTYSFPCQDLSNAGLKGGMKRGSGTRSGLLWEVERILTELKEADSLPDILLMENVGAILQRANKDDFMAWIERLDELGYTSDYALLNAKNYDVPQNRPRVFMVSNKQGKHYAFPRRNKARKVLKDILGEPDSKAWVKPDLARAYEAHKRRHRAKGDGFGWMPETTDTLAKTLTTRQNRRPEGTYLLLPQEDKPINGKDKVLTFDDEGNIYANGVKVRIRYFTPIECFRLMGVKDEDFRRIEEHQARDSLYHLAGDSIVVNVLMAIFKEMIEE